MIWPFRKPKPATRRRTLDGATVKAMLWDALKHATTANYRHLTLKDKLTVCDMDAIAAAGKKAFMPWKKDVWECEDQARALLHECQRRAANEGCSWACGILRGDDGRTHDINPTLHAFPSAASCATTPPRKRGRICGTSTTWTFQ